MSIIKYEGMLPSGIFKSSISDIDENDVVIVYGKTGKECTKRTEKIYEILKTYELL